MSTFFAHAAYASIAARSEEKQNSKNLNLRMPSAKIKKSPKLYFYTTYNMRIKIKISHMAVVYK
jgi:hypothetical protein